MRAAPGGSGYCRYHFAPRPALLLVHPDPIILDQYLDLQEHYFGRLRNRIVAMGHWHVGDHLTPYAPYL
jgi:hypothetical protein